MGQHRRSVQDSAEVDLEGRHIREEVRHYTYQRGVSPVAASTLHDPDGHPGCIGTLQ